MLDSESGWADWIPLVPPVLRCELGTEFDDDWISMYHWGVEWAGDWHRIWMTTEFRRRLNSDGWQNGPVTCTDFDDDWIRLAPDFDSDA